MSARPRPVTATFPPPVAVEYRQRSARSCSLSTGGSTASLLSVLDHDSYNEDDDYHARFSSAERSRELSPGRHQFDKQQSKSVCSNIGSVHRPSSLNSKGSLEHQQANSNQKHQSTAVTSRSKQVSLSSPQLRECSHNDDSGSENKRLSAWEMWVLRKAKEERDRLNHELEKQRLEKEKAERLQKEKEKKKQNAEVVIQAWVEAYDVTTKQRIELANQRRRAEKELKEAKKKEIETRAKEEFRSWLDRKDAEEKEKMRLKKEQEQVEERKKQEKLEQCKKAVDEWMSKNKKTRRTAPNSYGYCSGKLKGYYDANAYPTPSYVNPVPWRPIDIPPPPKPVAKKKAQKPQWNPSKYF